MKMVTIHRNWARVQVTTSIFIELEELNGHVTFADASKVDVKGRGKVLIQMKNGSINISPMFITCLP